MHELMSDQPVFIWTAQVNLDESWRVFEILTTALYIYGGYYIDYYSRVSMGELWMNKQYNIFLIPCN